MVNSKSEIDYIAGNFYKLENNEIEELIRLPYDFLISVLSSPALKLSSEDSLVDFIERVFQRKGSEMSGNENQIIYQFYEAVEFQNLSRDKFCEFIESFDESKMTRIIWQKMKQCIISHFDERPINSPRYSNPQFESTSDETFEYSGDESGSLNGIIAHLTEKCGGNVSEKNEVKVTSSSKNTGSRLAKHAVDFKSTEFFRSKDEQNLWLKYDFIDRKVRPTHYTIRSSCEGKGFHHPQNWAIEGSNTDRDDDWKMLDSKSNITDLDGKNQIHTFNIKENIKESFRFLRIRQTGKNSANSDHLTISALEFFGALI